MGARLKKDRQRDNQKPLEEQLARALADYDNLIKRVEKEKDRITLRATRRFVEDLLPALDDLERAQEHLKDEGLEMALNHLKRVFSTHGVEEIPARKGDKFDSQIHEAIDTAEGGRVGTIAKVLLKGYKWRDGSILRPVKVQVYGEKPEKEEELDQELTRGDYV